MIRGQLALIHDGNKTRFLIPFHQGAFQIDEKMRSLDLRTKIKLINKTIQRNREATRLVASVRKRKNLSFPLEY